VGSVCKVSICVPRAIQGNQRTPAKNHACGAAQSVWAGLACREVVHMMPDHDRLLMGVGWFAAFEFWNAATWSPAQACAPCRPLRAVCLFPLQCALLVLKKDAKLWCKMCF